MRTGVRRSAAAGVALAITAGVSGVAPVARAAASTTTISDVASARLGSGATSLLGYTARHEIGGRTVRGPLPGARIDRSDHAAAFDGVWGPDRGEIAAWLSPEALPALDPESSFVTNAYYSNAMGDGATTPLEAGDEVDVAVTDLVGNAFLPWDRERATPDGEATWDTASATRRISATYGGTSASSDVVVIRADIVARGGDVDARAAELPLPTLTMPLPQRYLRDVVPQWHLFTTSPYSSYARDVNVKVDAQLGTVSIDASLRGYLPEAREYTLSNGAGVAEWHVPIYVTVILDSQEDPLPAASALSLPDGAVVQAHDGVHTYRARAIRGTKLVMSHGAGLVATTGRLEALRRVEPGRDGSPPAPSTAVAAPSAQASPDASERPPSIVEADRAATVGPDLTEPVRLSGGRGEHSFVVDPDFGGRGFLALTSVERIATGRGRVETAAVPFAHLDGEPIALTNDRLVDLRLVPWSQGTGIAFAGAGLTGVPFARARVARGWIHLPGFRLQATYDLDGQTHVSVEMYSDPNERGPGPIFTTARVFRLDGAPARARTTQVVQVPGAGRVSLHDRPMTHEGTVTLDSRGANPFLTVGDHRVLAAAPGGPLGTATIVAAPAPLEPDPEPDPAVAIGGRAVWIVYSTATDAPETLTRVSLMPNDRPPPQPPELGRACDVVQVEDSGDEATEAAADVRRAWLADDGAFLYASIEVADVPTRAPAGKELSWTFHWRHEHGGYYAGASLTDDGRLLYSFGGYNGAFYQMGLVEPSGEVARRDDGPDVVRIAVPFGALGYGEGEALRDTGAHSFFLDATSQGFTDSAPEGGDPDYGTGAGYRIGSTCHGSPPAPTPTPTPPATPTPTPPATPTPTPTPTPGPTMTATPAPSPTTSSAPPSSTPTTTVAPSATPTPTAAPTSAPGPKPTLPPVSSPTPTPPRPTHAPASPTPASPAPSAATTPAGASPTPAAAGTTPVAPAPNSTTTLSAERSAVVYGETTALEGAVTRPGGCTTDAVVVERRLHGSPESAPFATVPVGPDGVWALPITPDHNASYLARPAATPACTGSTASPVDVLVVPKLRVARAPKCTRGRRISGSVRPAQPRTDVLLEARLRRGWTALRSATLDDGGRFSLDAARCRHRLRVVWPKQTPLNERAVALLGRR